MNCCSAAWRALVGGGEKFFVREPNDAILAARRNNLEPDVSRASPATNPAGHRLKQPISEGSQHLRRWAEYQFSK